LSTWSRFERFAADFLAEQRKNGERGAESAVRYEVVEREGRRYFKLTLREAMEFLLKKDYADNWSSELQEEFCFWSFSKWKRVLGEVGFRVVEGEGMSRAYTSEWIVSKRFEGKAELFCEEGGRLVRIAWPVTNMVLIGEKHATTSDHQSREHAARVKSIPEDVLADARMLWDFHVLPNEKVHSNVAICLGSSDLRVAIAAGELMLERLAPILVISGGFGKVTRGGLECEAVRFSRVVEEMGIDMGRVMLETEASHTGENFAFSQWLLVERGFDVRVATFVTKPYMMRRAMATARKQWPGVEWHAFAPAIAFEDYPTEGITLRQTVELMVGDLQRMEVYARRGFQERVEVPGEVWAAHERLVAAGFGRYLIRDP
jgi:uncharacterized SAM-binding protein YcdF (DUF218 family)